MHQKPVILQPERTRFLSGWRLGMVVCGGLLAGFLVGIFFSMLVTSFFPNLSDFWRIALFIAATAGFGFAMVWATFVEIARREEARRKGECLVEVPRNF